MRACGPATCEDYEDGFADPYVKKLKNKERIEIYLKPLTSKRKSLSIFAFDIESKDGPSQAAGFTRPFLVGFFDGEKYVHFRNSLAWNRHRSWTEEHLDEGGCIDQFLRFLFGHGLPNGHEDVRRYQKDAGWIYGHNAGKFDLLFVIGWLMRHRDEYVFEISSVMSKIQRLDVWRKGQDPAEDGCWTFVDSVGILPMTLEKVGETFCQNVFVDDAKDKNGNPIKLGKRRMDLNAEEWDERWPVYLKDDCRVLYHGLVAYQTMIHKLGGEVGITAPATAMKLFRRNFQKDWIYIGKHFPDCKGDCDDSFGLDAEGVPKSCERPLCVGKCHGCLHDFIRLAYYGGRTEVFRGYGSWILCYDINSSYPASMRAPMPIGKPVVFGPTDWKTLARARKNHVGFVECDVEIPADCKLPPLPWRVPEGRRITVTQPDGTVTVVPPGKLIFPTGKLSGVWDYDELCLLFHPLVNGKITNIRRSVWYEQKSIFVDFIDTLYAFRDKDDPQNYEGGIIERDAKGRITNEDDFNAALAEVCKLMMNSLYGKFGMRPDRTGLCTVEVEKGEAFWPEGGRPLFRSVHDEIDKISVWEIDRIVDAPYIIPSISAHITALSRIRLFMGAADVVAQGGMLYYMDTDSIQCSVSIPDSKKLGGWKLENPPDCVLECHYVLPKLYQQIAHKMTCEYALSFHTDLPTIQQWPAKKCRGCAFVFHHPECKKKFVNELELVKYLKTHVGDMIDKYDGKKIITKLGRVFTVNIHGIITCKGCSAQKHKMKGIGGRAQTLDNWDRLLKRDRNDPVISDRLSQHKTMLRKSAHLGVIGLTNLLTDRDGKLVGPMLSPVVVKAKKTLATNYDKRQFLSSGATLSVNIVCPDCRVSPCTCKKGRV